MANSTLSSRRREGRAGFDPCGDLKLCNPYRDSQEWQDYADGWNAAAEEYADIYPDYVNKKFKTLDIRVYRDVHKRPTCARNFLTGEFCLFLRTKRFGTLDVCAAAPVTAHHADGLNRRLTSGYEELGSLEPAPWCPLWNKNLEDRDNDETKNENL